MDNNIKKRVNIGVIILILLLPSCIGWLDRDYLYEIKINEGVSIVYFAEGDQFLSTHFRLYASPNKKLKKNSSKQLSSSDDLKGRIRLEQNCMEVIYNESYALAVIGLNEYSVKKYHRYRLARAIGNSWELEKDTLTVHEFDSIASRCTNCEHIDAAKIRNMQAQ